MMILHTFVCGPLQNNTIVVACEKTKKAAVIDPAFSSASKVLAFIEENNLELESILLTHSHWDHVGDVARIQKKTNCKIYVHKLDAPNLINPGSDGLMQVVKYESIQPDYLLEGNEKIHIGDLTLDVIHTPGHSPGCVCYYLKDKKILFSGDTLFRGSMGKVSFPNSSPDLMWSSLKKLAKLSHDTRVIPGHGEETVIEDESWLEDAKELFS